jgi:hypothetical protein
MNKQYCVISCPIDTYSGYGARSRDFVKALYELKKDEWDIGILAQRWGATPWNYIEENSKDWDFLNSLIIRTGQLTKQPDVWIQITIPSEFQPIGKHNIGVTAGIETTICHASWIDGCNRMNLVLVSSNHAKTVFKGSEFQENNQNGQVVRTIKLQKPVEVLFEGVDLSKYFCIPENEINQTDLVKCINEVKESFCYLFVGHWLQGDLGEDRKNVGLMLKNFLETFKGKKSKPALIMKTSGAGSSVMDRDEILKKIDYVKKIVGGNDLPNVYVLHGDIEDSDMNDLYNHPKVKAMLNLTKGEGFGRPLLEFSLCKKPIITTSYSGQLDFLDPEFTVLINGEIKQIHPSAVVENMLIPESGWFSPNLGEFKYYMKDIFENYNKYIDNAKRQSHKSKTKFSFDCMKDVLSNYLDLVPKKVELKLPALKKIELPKLKKLD